MADGKTVAVKITANTSELRRGMRQASQELKGFEASATHLDNKLRGMRMRMERTGIFGRGGGALRTAAGFAGVYGFAQMIESAKSADAALTDIAITGNLSDAELKKLGKTITDVSNRTAKSKAELASFVATVTTMTGDARGAAEALEGIGETMVATGASGEALAGVYVKLTTTMGLMPKQAREAFNVLRSQEKLGSVTMANIATNFGKIIGAGSVYGEEGKGIKGVRTLGGLYQIAQRAFGVGSEGTAANDAAGFLSFMARNSKLIKKEFGVDIFYESGKSRDLPTVFEELGKSFNKNKKAFREKGQLLFGRAGIQTARQLAEAARAPGGFAGQVGKFSSANALLRTAGGMDVIGSDAARRRKSASYQFDEQLNILRNALKKHITPVFKELASGMKKWGPDLVKTVKFLLNNSRTLLELWLGYKGITFFRNLIAPLGGGGTGGAMGGAGALAAGGAAVGGAAAGGRMGRFAAAGQLAASFAEGVLLGKTAAKLALDNISAKTVRDATGWKNADLLFGSDKEFEAGLETQAKNERRSRVQGWAPKAWKSNLEREFTTPEGIDVRKGIQSGSKEAQAAIESGDPARIQAALANMLSVRGRFTTLRKGLQKKNWGLRGTWGLMTEHQRKSMLGEDVGGMYTDIDRLRMVLKSSIIDKYGGGVSAKEMLGLTSGGVKGIRNFQSLLKPSIGLAREDAEKKLAMLEPGAKPTEENLTRVDGRYAMLKRLFETLDGFAKAIAANRHFTVTALMPDGSTPGVRADKNSKPAPRRGA